MTLNDRRNEFESRYAHDQETRFKIEARRNKLFGLWAAGLLGRTGADADAYAQDVVRASFAKPGDDDLIEKVRADFDAAGVDQSEDDVRRQIAASLVEAEQQIANG